MPADRAQGLRQQPVVPADITSRGRLIQHRQNPGLRRWAIDHRLAETGSILQADEPLG